MRACLLILVCAMVFPACSSAPQAPTREADIAAINALLEEMAAALNAGDADAYMSVFTENAVWMVPNQKAILKQKDAHIWFRGVFTRNRFDIKAYTDELEVTGDWAYARRTYRGQVVRKATDQVVARGSSRLSILERQPEAGWKITHDIWNSDFLRSEPEPESSQPTT